MLFYIRIELDRSNVDGRSFQAQPDKMLHFQSLAGFQRICSKLPNFPESIENTGQNGFLGFADNSSQIVDTYDVLLELTCIDETEYFLEGVELLEAGDEIE